MPASARRGLAFSEGAPAYGRVCLPGEEEMSQGQTGPAPAASALADYRDTEATTHAADGTRQMNGPQGPDKYVRHCRAWINHVSFRAKSPAERSLPQPGFEGP